MTIRIDLHGGPLDGEQREIDADLAPATWTHNADDGSTATYSRDDQSEGPDTEGEPYSYHFAEPEDS